MKITSEFNTILQECHKHYTGSIASKTVEFSDFLVLLLRFGVEAVFAGVDPSNGWKKSQPDYPRARVHTRKYGVDPSPEDSQERSYTRSDEKNLRKSLKQSFSPQNTNTQVDTTSGKNRHVGQEKKDHMQQAFDWVQSEGYDLETFKAFLDRFGLKSKATLSRIMAIMYEGSGAKRMLFEAMNKTIASSPNAPVQYLQAVVRSELAKLRQGTYPTGKSVAQVMREQDQHVQDVKRRTAEHMDDFLTSWMALDETTQSEIDEIAMAKIDKLVRTVPSVGRKIQSEPDLADRLLDLHRMRVMAERGCVQRGGQDALY